MSKAIKHDAGKPDYSLLPLSHLEPAVRALEFGAKKYTRDNWKNGFGGTARPLASALRHLAAFQNGERVDAESGVSHIGHAMCCLIFLMNELALEEGASND